MIEYASDPLSTNWNKFSSEEWFFRSYCKKKRKYSQKKTCFLAYASLILEKDTIPETFTALHSLLFSNLQDHLSMHGRWKNLPLNICPQDLRRYLQQVMHNRKPRVNLLPAPAL